MTWKFQAEVDVATLTLEDVLQQPSSILILSAASLQYHATINGNSNGFLYHRSGSALHIEHCVLLGKASEIL